MIEVIFDAFGLEDNGSAIVVHAPSDYAQCRLRIRGATARGDNLRLIVRNAGMAGWFGDLVGDGQVTLLTRDPLRELKEHLDTADLPAILRNNPRLVGAWGLLNGERKPHSQGVIDWILERQLAAVWGRTELHADSVTELLGWLGSSQWADIDPELRDLAARKLDSWSDGNQFDVLLRWIRVDPQGRSVLFALCQRLANYPVGEVINWLGAMAWSTLAALENWDKVARALPVVKLDEQLIPANLNVSVRTYLLSQAGSGASKLEDLAGRITGLLPGEVAALEKMLDTWVPPVSRHAVEALRTKLGDHSLVAGFEELVPPPSPAAFPSGAAADVLAWVTSSYLPYYRWTRRTKQELLTAHCAAEFESWYLQNISAISQKLDLLALGITDHATKVAGDSVLIVIVDGLGAEWITDLSAILEGEGLKATLPIHTRLTVAPSITEFAKPAMIRGVRPEALPDKSWNTIEYQSLLAARWPDRRVHAISDLDSHRKLRQLVTTEEDGSGHYLYLANRLDEILHQSMSQYKRQQEVRSYLTEICASIRQACEHYHVSFGKPLPVVITGDHGHCVLPGTATGLTMPVSGSETHGRVVILEDTPAAVPAGAILLEAKAWGLKRPILIASGYAYWGNRPAGGVHGGLTPEEMVVPVFTVQAGAATSPRQSDPLVFTLLDTVRRNRPDNVALIQIINPNTRPVDIIHVEIAGFQLLDILPDKIEAENKIELKVNVDGRGMRTEVALVEGHCTYQCDGKPVQQQVSIAVKTTGGAIDDFDIF